MKRISYEKKSELYKNIGQLQIENQFLKKVQETVWARSGLLEPDNDSLSIKNQCRLLGMSRSSYYYKPQNANEDVSFCFDTLEEAIMVYGIPAIFNMSSRIAVYF